MARYAALLGRRVEVQYRAGDVLLPATGTLVADSGKSVFLEEHYNQRGSVKHFRWEIPYPCILSLAEVCLRPQPAEAAAAASSQSVESQAADPHVLPRLKSRPGEA